VKLFAAFLIIFGFVLSQKALAWDDKSINEDSIEQFCDMGFGNPGFVSNIMMGRLYAGTTTQSDFNGIKRYMRKNCPGSW